MKIIISLLCMCLFISSCKGQKKEQTFCQIEQIVSVDFTNIQEGDFIKKCSISKQNSQIIIQLENNSILNLRDTLVEDESPEMELYEIIGFIPQNNNYIIKVTYLLDDEIWFIDKSNGRINKALSYISVSKSGLIATYNMPQSDRYDGVQVFRLEKGIRSDLCSVKDSNWFPEHIKWNGDKELYLQVYRNGKKEYLMMKVE